MSPLRALSVIFRGLLREATMVLDLSISVISFPGLSVVTVRGEVDVATVRELRLALFGACHRSSGKVILDLRDVTFFDCSGIGALVAARRRLPDGASLCLVSTHPIIRRIFAITGLWAAFPLHASLLSAMASPSDVPSSRDQLFGTSG
jgi:anti-sigma B factor antagonist